MPEIGRTPGTKWPRVVHLQQALWRAARGQGKEKGTEVPVFFSAI